MLISTKKTRTQTRTFCSFGEGYSVVVVFGLCIHSLDISSNCYKSVTYVVVRTNLDKGGVKQVLSANEVLALATVAPNRAAC